MHMLQDDFNRIFETQFAPSLLLALLSQKARVLSRLHFPKCSSHGNAYDPFLALCLVCENVFVSQDIISITSSHALALVMGPKLRSWQDKTSHWILVGLHVKGPILWTMQISCQDSLGLFNYLPTCINFVKNRLGMPSNSFNTWDHLLLGEILNLPSNLKDSSLEVHYVRFSS
jgi:hypothetical protein